MGKYFSTKEPKTYSGERKATSINDGGNIGMPHAKR